MFGHCYNCQNAFNDFSSKKVFCLHKSFDENCIHFVSRHDSCDRYENRDPKHSTLFFNRSIQLTFDFK